MTSKTEISGDSPSAQDLLQMMIQEGQIVTVEAEYDENGKEIYRLPERPVKEEPKPEPVVVERVLDAK